MSLKSRIVALRELPRGRRRLLRRAVARASAPARIATVPVGYADGYRGARPARPRCWSAAVRCPVVGAITMDMCMVDVTAVPAAKLGDEVVLLGAQGAASAISADEWRRWAGTIAWEVFCGISKRVPRVYVGERW